MHENVLLDLNLKHGTEIRNEFFGNYNLLIYELTKIVFPFCKLTCENKTK